MRTGSAPEFIEPAPLVLLWPDGPEEDSAATLGAVLASTAADTTVILPAGTAGPRLRENVEGWAPDRVTVLDPAGDGSFAAAFEAAKRTSARADLAVIIGAWILPDGWLEGLRRAANCDDTVAAAHPLTIAAGESLFAGFSTIRALPVTDAAHRPELAGVAMSAPGVHPRIGALSPACVYLRRAPLELLGGADRGLTHPAAVLADLLARAVAAGMSFTLADDVRLEPRGAGVSPPPRAELSELARRHPWIDAAREDAAVAEVGPLRRSLIAARAAHRGLSVTIDARNLGSSFGGTQTYTAALVRSLAHSGLLTVRAVLSDDVAVKLSAPLFEGCQVEVVTYEEAVAGRIRTDLVHRPQQVFSPDDLSLLRLLGERVVISHLDLIAYRSPVYHRSPDEWRSYRRTTRLALSVADRVVFLSEHAQRDAVAEDLIDAARTAVVGIGVDGGARADVRRPDRVPAGRAFLVMLGADYLHKNRVFSLMLLAELRRRHGWDGLLVLAGRHVPYGSSAQAEADLLSANSDLAAHVVDLGPVDEGEKRWLLQEAEALLCPSTYEGYGLTPLEAAAAGLPCAYPALTSLFDVLGPEAATMVPWDPVLSADAIVPLLRPGAERDRHLGLLERALSRYRWDSIADRLCQTYVEAIQSPFRSATPRAWEDLEREQLIVQLDGKYQDLRARVAHGLSLIDQGGLLTHAEQRGLTRIAKRRWLRAPVLGPIGFLGGIRREGH